MTPKDTKQGSRSPKICLACGEEFIPPRYNSKYCDTKCFGLARKASPRKSVGKTYDIVTKDGVKRRLVLVPDGRHVAEHRLIFEQHWNVKLKKWHRVRHINGDTLDNRIENLTLDNEYAMQLLREGKSIAEVGHSICPKGHPRTRVHHMANGGIRHACEICMRANAKKYRKPKTKRSQPSE